jgi:transcription-repair coupling factor (superfamily II helicase)
LFLQKPPRTETYNPHQAGPPGPAYSGFPRVCARLDLHGLLSLLTRREGFRALASALRAGGRWRLPLADAAKGYVTAALAEELAVPILIVVPSAGRSRRLVDALRAWLGERRAVELFAERDALPYERLATDPITEQNRLRALAALASAHAPVVVTTGRALMDCLAGPEQFETRFVELRPGSVSDPNALAEHLVRAGYSASPLVEAPGTFSRRGGIVDVFPPTEGFPIRVEFFGDEVDSIRRFDPLTQRSTELLGGARVGPALELFPEAGPAIDRLAALDVEPLREESRADWQRDLDRLATGDPFDGIALYAGHLGRATVLDYFPADGLLLVEEPEAVQVAVEQIEAQARELYAELTTKGELPAGLAAPYRGWDDLAPSLRRRDGLDLTWRDAPSEEEAPLPSRGGPFAPLVDALRPVTSYGGRLKTVIDDVAAALGARQRVVIVSQQAARLAELFGERDLPVGRVADVDEAPPAGTLTLVQGAATEGFQLADGPDGGLLLLTDYEVFGWTKPRRAMRPRAAARDTFLSDLAAGDYVVHVEHGVGRFAGLVRMQSDGVDREYLQLEYGAGDRLFVPVDQADRVSRYVGVGDGTPTLHRLGGTEWARAKSRVKAAVQQMAKELLELYAAREVTPGHAFAPDTVWQAELEASFPYVETADQLAAIADVKADMEKPRPMDRLLCGDVGYGKTEVALRAAFKAVMDGKQVAVLVPTTVLAQQHYNTFLERMQAFPVRVEMLSRFRSAREQRTIVEGLKSGAVDIVIGTHRLVQNDVQFKDLGLVVIDEEQRFGVGHKERLKQLRKEVDVLTLTATPIPRTLHMSLAGVRDMSTMETAPEDRLPIRTYVQAWDDGVVREAILRELDRGGQVYFVHNRVQTIYQQAQRLRALVPQATFVVGHGQLAEEQLEKVMVQFADGKADVLVCSTIIESGLDIPNVNTIIVNNADMFGLAQLYQLRGRVGRGANRAYAYFLYRKGAQLSEVAEKRLRTIFEANELGAGFRIAMKDLEIRGAGNLLGPEQSGHVAAVGFTLYTQLLAEAVGELRGQPVEAPLEVTIDLPVDAFLPSDYVADEQARLSIYRRLASVRSVAEVGEIVAELRERYGPLPERALDLIWLLQLKTTAQAAGVVAINTNDQAIVLRFAQEQPARLKALEPRFAPYFRAGRAYAFLDRVGLGARWQETLDKVLDALAESAPTPSASALVTSAAR